MITEFGEFEFEINGERRSFPVYNFTRGLPNSYSFMIKIDDKWKIILYLNSMNNPTWLWTARNSRSKESLYDAFPYKVVRFYYNTTLELVD